MVNSQNWFLDFWELPVKGPYTRTLPTSSIFWIRENHTTLILSLGLLFLKFSNVNPYFLLLSYLLPYCSQHPCLHFHSSILQLVPLFSFLIFLLCISFCFLAKEWCHKEIFATALVGSCPCCISWILISKRGCFPLPNWGSSFCSLAASTFLLQIFLFIALPVMHPLLLLSLIFIDFQYHASLFHNQSFAMLVVLIPFLSYD